MLVRIDRDGAAGAERASGWGSRMRPPPLPTRRPINKTPADQLRENELRRIPSHAPDRSPIVLDWRAPD